MGKSIEELERELEKEKRKNESLREIKSLGMKRESLKKQIRQERINRTNIGRFVNKAKTLGKNLSEGYKNFKKNQKAIPKSKGKPLRKINIDDAFNIMP